MFDVAFRIFCRYFDVVLGSVPQKLLIKLLHILSLRFVYIVFVYFSPEHYICRFKLLFSFIFLLYLLMLSLLRLLTATVLTDSCSCRDFLPVVVGWAASVAVQLWNVGW